MSVNMRRGVRVNDSFLVQEVGLLIKFVHFVVDGMIMRVHT